MKIIKLNAIPSTNDYLKKFVKENDCPNYMVVQTNFQSNGKGQMHHKWHSEKGKNLLFSILIKDLKLNLIFFFKLHTQVSLAVYSVLHDKIPFIKIKWPNDIMSRKKKIAGILIENSVKNGIINQSIIGIGLNVNQIDFPESLPNAISMKKSVSKDFDRNQILSEIVLKIKENLEQLNTDYRSEYCANLYQYCIPATYLDVSKNTLFLGRIMGISKQGNLLVSLENDVVKEFGFKEIKFL